MKSKEAEYYANIIREALKEVEKRQYSESEMLCYKYKKFKKKHSKTE
jgi:hypothetical protein